MFYALAVTLCLAVLFLVLGTTYLVCIPAAKLVGKKAGSISPALAANLLFALRLMPLGLACLVTLGFALPSFVEFEPDASGEGMSRRLIILAIAGAAVLLVLVFRVTRILAATYRAQKQWVARSRRLKIAGIESPVHCVEGRSSILAVTGVFRSRIFVAKEIVESLTADELSAALAHEMAHVASFDNLKQLLLRVTRLPRWLSLLYTDDAAWTSASEVAADRAALAGGASALDLSSALVKVGRLNRPASLHTAVAASHLLPPACATSLEARVLRLQEALEGNEPIPGDESNTAWRRRAMPIALLSVVVYAVAAHAMLPAIHEVLEFLVR